MNRLTYAEQPEIMTVTTPLGNTHHIPVWLPVGERTMPVSWTEPEAVTFEELPQPTVKLEYIYQRIIAWMQDHGDTGFTTWEIADAINENRQVVGQNLQHKNHLFWRSSKKTAVAWVTSKGQERRWRMNLWHLQKEDE